MVCHRRYAIILALLASSAGFHTALAAQPNAGPPKSGVRMYKWVDEHGVSLVVHLEEQDELLLFVVLRPDLELDDEILKRIAGALRNSLSPRPAPDTIVAVPAIPRTLTGKKLEVPVKRILTGADVSQVASSDALVEPSSIEPFAEYARTREQSAATTS